MSAQDHPPDRPPGSSPSRLRWVPYVVLGAAAAVAAAIGIQTWRGYDHDARLVLYSVRHRLHYGMSRDDVHAVLQEEEAKARVLKYAGTSDRRHLTAWVDESPFRTVNLLMEFSGDRLTHADIRGDEGPMDHVHDAPPDLRPPPDPK